MPKEIADAYLAENKLRLEVIQFLLVLFDDKVISYKRLNNNEHTRLKAIEARYGRK